MKGYADNGFGDLVLISNPYGHSMNVYLRLDGKVACFTAGTDDHVAAIDAVRKSENHQRLSRSGRWSGGPVLAVIK